MSAESELARFDTRPRRAAQDGEYSEQIDLRALGAREQGQLALNELSTKSRVTTEQRNVETQIDEEPMRADLEAALGCARATIDGLREQVSHLEAEHERLREELEGER